MKEIHLLNCMNEGEIEAGCDEAGRGPLAGPVFAAAVILPPDFHHPLLNDSKRMSEKARDILRPIIEAEAVAWAVEAVSAAEIDRLNILNASIAGMQRALMRLSPVPEHLLIDGNRWRTFSFIRNLVKTGPDPELFPAVQQMTSEGSFKETLSFDTTSRCEDKILTEENRSCGEEPDRNTEERARRYDSIPVDCIVKGDGKFTAIAAASVLAKTHRDEYMRRIAAFYPDYGWDRNMGYPTPEHIAAIRAHGLTPHHRLSFKLNGMTKFKDSF